ncbi:MAG TPA: helix-turn-helix domain-containing protein [Gemmataceae bacterium]|nr:helix-turn-helix domain-containing protein [Gemmataceae bacterium]
MKLPSSRLSSEERRAAIIQAVRRLFADKGFDGTTTRELAEAAGVSEALLFKHFPNKEALYSAMLLACCPAKDATVAERLRALEPSTSSLVILVHHFFARALEGHGPHDEAQEIQHRLMLRSLLEDGEFARLFLERVAAGWLTKVEQSLKAAIAAGEAVASPVGTRRASWFVEHLTVALMTRLRPATPVVDYGASRKQLVEQAVWFCLRGMGLTDETIRRYYNPKALRLLEP